MKEDDFKEVIILQSTADLALKSGFDYRVPIDRWLRLSNTPCPQSLLQKWLRNKHNFHVNIVRGQNGDFGWSSVHIDNMPVYAGFLERYPSYEVALESFLIFALRSISPEVKFLFQS